MIRFTDKRLRILWGCVLLGVYLPLEWLESGMGNAPLGVTPWDPSIGVAFGALLLGGLGFLPVVLVGEGGSIFLAHDAGASLLKGGLEVLILGASWGTAAVFLRRHIDTNLSRQYDLVVLVLVAALFALIGALGHVALIWVEGSPPEALFSLTLARAWVGSMIGVMVVTPVMLVHRRLPRLVTPRTITEVCLQSLLVILVMWVVFSDISGGGLRLFYLLFVPSIWVAARFGLGGAVLVNLVLQIGMAIALALAVVEIGTVTGNQFRMLSLSLSTLFLGAAVSERRRIECELRERQDQQARYARLSTVGEMAAALAHELNQPLAATITYTRAAQRLLALPQADFAKVRDAMDGAAGQAERAGRIIRTLREFIGQGELNREAHSVASLVYDSVALMRPECSRSGVHLEVSLARGLATVEVDAVQIQQVLVNLIRNGVEVLGNSDPARRAIHVAAGHNAQGDVVIEVGDTGPGMAEEMAERLFQPFSTNKAEGMGLGLSISRTIIDAHGGRLWLAASGPDGCSFRFTLPKPPQHG